MIRDLIVSLLLFLAVVVGALYLASYLGQLTTRDAGYVFISAHGYAIETSVFVLGALSAGFALVSYIAISAFVWIWQLIFERRKRRQRAAYKQLLEGLQKLSVGQWKRAEPVLLKSAKADVYPGLGYAGAALAAEKRGDSEVAKSYWLQIGLLTGESALVAAMARAELALERNQPGLARDLLEPFAGTVRDYPRLQAMLARVLVHHQDWENLEKLLAVLQESDALDKGELRELQRQVHSAQFAKLGNNVAQLQLRWSRLNESLQADEGVFLAFISQLHDAGEVSEAESRLRTALEEQWSDRLIQAYCQLTRVNAQTRLANAEKWLADQHNNAILLKTLGRVARECDQLIKARDYLQMALKLRPDAETYEQLAEVLEDLGDADGAKSCYRNGLHQLTGRPNESPSTPNTPALT